LSQTPEEDALTSCYAANKPKDRDILPELIGRLREKHTLEALSALVDHLELLRPERKFVMVFTEGWPLYRPNEALSRVLDGRVPSLDPVTSDPRTGGFRRNSDDPQTGSQTLESCDRTRTMLAYSDHE